jgi:hypothetical protein
VGGGGKGRGRGKVKGKDGRMEGWKEGEGKEGGWKDGRTTPPAAQTTLSQSNGLESASAVASLHIKSVNRCSNVVNTSTAQREWF